MDDPGRIGFEDDFSGGAGSEAEEGERAGGEERGECSKDVEVGGGEELVGE